MGRYLARRLLLLLPVALGITIVTFFLLRLIPGDPAVIMLDNRATAENVARLRHQLGLDRPLSVQYLLFLRNIVTGQLGDSLVYRSAVLPIIVGAVSGWAIATVPQLGWPPAFKWPSFNFPPLFNLGAILGIISPRAAFARIGQASAKVIAVGGVAALGLALELRDFIDAPALDAPALAVRLGGAVARIFLYSGLVLAPLAIVDYIRAKRRIMERMRMTPAEVKREFREQEGDPTNKRRRRQRMRELAKRRVAQAVKGADVVLVNPTEYAVALRYDSDEDRAPRVLAKGRGEPAERIRELARQNGIPIVAEPPLTRMIYKLVPEGREIPAALYKAVAEVLAYVYRLRRRGA